MIDKCYIKISDNKVLLLEVLRKLNMKGIKWSSLFKEWNYIPTDCVDAIYIDGNRITYSSNHRSLCRDYPEVSEYKEITDLYIINKKDLYND
jgi:hypothetical protein